MAVRCDANFRNRIEIIHAERTHALSRAAHTQYDTHTRKITIASGLESARSYEISLSHRPPDPPHS